MSNQNRNYRFKELNTVWLFRPIRLYGGKRRRRRRNRSRYQPRLDLPEIVQTPEIAQKHGAKQILGAVFALAVFSAAIWLLAAVGEQVWKLVEFFAEYGLWSVFIGFVIIAACSLGVTLLRRRGW